MVSHIKPSGTFSNQVGWQLPPTNQNSHTIRYRFLSLYLCLRKFKNYWKLIFWALLGVSGSHFGFWIIHLLMFRFEKLYYPVLSLNTCQMCWEWWNSGNDNFKPIFMPFLAMTSGTKKKFVSYQSNQFFVSKCQFWWWNEGLKAPSDSMSLS